MNVSTVPSCSPMNFSWSGLSCPQQHPPVYSPASLRVCEGCHKLFTVTGDYTVTEWGGAVCLGLNCSTYDVERDVDLTFEIEPWRVRRTAIGDGDE